MRAARLLAAAATLATLAVLLATAAPARAQQSGRLCGNAEFIGVRGSGDASSTLGVMATALDTDMRSLVRDRAVLGYESYGLPYTAVGLELGVSLAATAAG